ncbi:hypothetical protein Tco_0047751 [Tanacetum coccineum]
MVRSPGEKGRLEVVEASLRQKVEAVKCDRAEVVSKVVPYVAIELVHSDEMDMLVGKLVSSAIFYHTYAAFEEVVNMKEPFDLVLAFQEVEVSLPSDSNEDPCSFFASSFLEGYSIHCSFTKANVSFICHLKVIVLVLIQFQG